VVKVKKNTAALSSLITLYPFMIHYTAWEHTFKLHLSYIATPVSTLALCCCMLYKHQPPNPVMPCLFTHCALAASGCAERKTEEE